MCLSHINTESTFQASFPPGIVSALDTTAVKLRFTKCRLLASDSLEAKVNEILGIESPLKDGIPVLSSPIVISLTTTFSRCPRKSPLGCANS